MTDSENPGFLDARGYRCPIPVIRLEAALRRLLPGQRILIWSDDPVAAIDIPHFCREGGHIAERRQVRGESEEICGFLVTRGGK